MPLLLLPALTRGKYTSPAVRCRYFPRRAFLVASRQFGIPFVVVTTTCGGQEQGGHHSHTCHRSKYLIHFILLFYNHFFSVMDIDTPLVGFA